MALTLSGVTVRLRDAFYKDKVTRKFYDRFKKEHGTFLSFIKGITAKGDREWYASLMVNRLMFIYFIQRKGFLDGDGDYLRKRMKAMQARKGKDRFLSFYRYFLLRLFHEGLGQQTRSPELEELLGAVPYLNGGLFDVHDLERQNPDIEIPDEAFENLFKFFDQYQWHLDERPLGNDQEINPDVLGYIFEKYINQKQMGAYYTKEDITEYIGKNTIIPFLLDAAAKKCTIAFRADGALWRLLRENPDSYIYDAVRKGVDIPLPSEIEAGVSDVSKRGGWNRPAAEGYALPTETWREHVARRTRCLELRAKLAAGEIHAVNDLITYNLNILQFIQDAIVTCEGPELLRAFWHTLAGKFQEKSNEKFEPGMSILDPTCGSGAFLFAALNILAPLYEACLVRMQAFVGDLDRSGEAHHPEKYGDFRRILSRIDEHTNHDYFILKSIILGNLYGVDIMAEAVEICKLRLFLKLAAQVEPDRTKPNFGLEPLPDIDFNIRTGNTLVGFATLNEVRASIRLAQNQSKAARSTERIQFKLEDDESLAAIARIEESAENADHAYQRFREMQAVRGMDAAAFAGAKIELRRQLAPLAAELDRHLAGEYGIDTTVTDAFARWRASHTPFHWLVEFYGIVLGGGFDVIVGNPPYVEYGDVKHEYTVSNFVSLECGDLYGYVAERSYGLARERGYVGLIVPISMFGTDGFKSLQSVALAAYSDLWVSSFANRPSQLFSGAQKRLNIVIGRISRSRSPHIFTSSYLRWKSNERPSLFNTRVTYSQETAYFRVFDTSLEKLGSDVEVSAFRKLAVIPQKIGDALASTGEHEVFYTRKFGYFLAFTNFIPNITDVRSGRSVPPSELKDLRFPSRLTANVAIASLSSSTFFWFWNVLSDCRNLNRRDILAFTIDPRVVDGETRRELADLAHEYLVKLRRSAKTMNKSGLIIETFDYSSCKPVIDQIDRLLAKHYGFTEEELDFVINYDIKYRMGREPGEDGERE